MNKFIIAATLLLSSTLYAKSFSFMQYNAENFFDTKHDVGTEDFTYLPLSVKKNLEGHEEYCRNQDGPRKSDCFNLDWNEAKFTKKIVNISKAIKSFDKTGKGPDVVVFQEVENINALNKLVTKGLDKLGYRHIILIEGDDSRGIDVGLISKIPVVSAKHHSLVINGQVEDTRGILEVTLDVDGNKVVIFVNHWPSQNNPTFQRIASAELIEKLASRMTDADLIIAAGDFNTTKTDFPNPFESMKSFIDLEKETRASGFKIHPGTHYYKGEWTSLDRIFIHKNYFLKPDLSKFTIINHSFLMKPDSRTGDLTPFRFSHHTGEGFSDHLPLSIVFNY